MKKGAFLIVLIFLGFGIKSNAQTFASKQFYLVDSLDLKSLTIQDKSLLDSVLTQYHLAVNDSIKLNYITEIISDCENEIWIKYNELLLIESNRLITKNKKNKDLQKTYKKFIASAFNNFGFLYFKEDDLPKAISYFTKAIAVSNEINNIEVIPTALNNLGFIYKLQGDILKALDYYHQSLKLNTKFKNEREMALALNNIGGIYFKQNELEKASKYFIEALLLEKKSGTQKGVARLYSNIGSIYKNQNKLTQAKDYFDQSLKIYQEIGNKSGEAATITKLSLVEMDLYHLNQEEYQINLNQVLDMQKKALRLFDEINDSENKSYAYANLSRTYKELGNLTKANEFAAKSYELAQQIGYPEAIKNSAEILKGLAVEKKDYKSAYFMLDLFYTMQDSVNSQSIKELSIQKQFQYEYEKKLVADSIKSAEKDKVNKAEITVKDEQIKRQTTQRYALFGGVMILLIFGGFTYKRYKVSQGQKKIIEEQKEIVEIKSKEITDSINYAKRIQDAILPSSAELKKHLKDGFVLYLPKDIVAGDFYWMESLSAVSNSQSSVHSLMKTENCGLILLAAADCTGHGVPGAMVSVVCNSALNRAVGEFHLTQPAEILNKVRELVIETFEQSGEEMEVRDGMDISLLKFNKSDFSIEWAGANNPLWIARKGSSELLEYKPNKQPIGRHFKQEPFTNHKVDLQKNDVLYLFTDGYTDQFGGEKGKKMMYKPFKELLLSIQDKTMDEQKIELEQFFMNWKGNLEQVDDVCIIGVRLS